MSEAESITEEQLEDMIPTPVGYRVLIALPQVEETFQDSALVKSSQTRHEEHVMSIIGLVVDVGEQAYADKDRFPTGAWCKQGDYVMFRANSGTRFKVGGTEYRLMNDDSVEAVVPDPTGISRA
jgi:co-chaperonin GroES (HSP10)|tara:strand:- start:40 stop:411 length:372 start_codon:yes stop_codon:yes gene_type:complete